ncbi:hypothetical protein SADUNF_Sadunf02G0002900 [Salix dunnii]|uniref:NAD-dependent epimerase/dehydratase domain-containing protein n=1 Tax=Salix dunnii TaxID=1413687 RepID=A0A835N5C1_9ROSI|nr:hypothetical protein SADUNF_Sadunf02G0002900 [Salix dunnii]
MEAEKGRVCVTGAGGFLGSWLLKVLLSKNYLVHGTVRDPADEKYAHLKTVDKASENLKLFKADLLDYNSLCSAIKGCEGVFHVASPVPSTTVPNPEASVELIEPAVKGTLNVLRACDEAKVKRVVVVSSVVSVYMNPSLPKGQMMDEKCWSDKEYCRATKNWYCLSKTAAESEAWECVKTSGLDVVTICPSLILGPILHSAVNASSKSVPVAHGSLEARNLKPRILCHLLIAHCCSARDAIAEGYESLENKLRHLVDVRDVAEALLLVYEKPEAEGRYICTAHAIRTKDLEEKLRNIYPNYNYPKSFTEEEAGIKLSSEKLQRLGWSYRPLEETLMDSVESYQKTGILD